MTAAAVYARKSVDQAGIPDAEKSVARQVEHARAYATRKGWTVAEEHVYVDDGISGAIFGDKRPGLARLLNALSPRPPFQFLVMSEESRLGREQIETAYALKRITDSGVRVFLYLEGRERTLDSAMDKVMLGLTSFASEMERERARQRTHDALLKKARAGHVANGATFGYRNVRAVDGGPVIREIVLSEAETIRRIFDMVAAGLSFIKIAITLNNEGVPSPAPRRRVKPGGWAPSTVRSLVMRDTYRGVTTWNKAQRIVRGGTRKRIDRPASDWIEVKTPQTRIVTDDAWNAAHSRLAASRATYLAVTGGQIFGRPAPGTPARYLLTGLGTCGGCGSSMFIGRTHYARDGWRHYLGCVGHHQRGNMICKNALTVPLADADEGVLSSVERDLLRVEIFETSLAKAQEATERAPEGAETRLRALHEKLTSLDAEVGRLAEAIAAGGELPALVAALQERERHRTQLRAELAALQRSRKPRTHDQRQVLDLLRDALAQWRTTLRQEIPQARKTLSALLAGRLVFTPHEREGERFYAFEGPGTVSKIIAGLALPSAMMTR